MEKIEGISLSDEVVAANNELLENKKLEVRHKIASIIGSYNHANGTIFKLERDLTKAKQCLKKYQDQLDALSQGKWEVLQDSGTGSKLNEPEAAQP